MGEREGEEKEMGDRKRDGRLRKFLEETDRVRRIETDVRFNIDIRRQRTKARLYNRRKRPMEDDK